MADDSEALVCHSRAMCARNAMRQVATGGDSAGTNATVWRSGVTDDRVALDGLAALVARAIRLTLQTDSRIGTVMTTNCPEAAVARIKAGPEEEAPDVMLIDVNYRGIDRTGIEALPEIRDASPRSKLLIMSVARDAATVRAALANDADGYIWKNESAVDFAEAVVSATHHNFVASKSIARDVLAAAEPV